MSTRYHSSGSIWPRPPRVPRIVVSLPRASSSALARVVLSPLHSLSRFARFFLRPLYAAAASSSSLAPFLTLGERVLSAFPPCRPSSFPTPHPLATAASVHVLRPSGCFPRPRQLSLSFFLSLSASILLHHTRAPRINPSPSAFRICFLAPVLSFFFWHSPPRAPLSLDLPSRHR